jgi:hypothetical protein
LIYRTVRSSSRFEIADVAEKAKAHVFLVQCVEGAFDAILPEQTTILPKTAARTTGDNPSMANKERVKRLKQGPSPVVVVRRGEAIPRLLRGGISELSGIRVWPTVAIKPIAVESENSDA